MSEVTTNISNVDSFCVRLFETNLLSEFKLFLKTCFYLLHTGWIYSLHIVPSYIAEKEMKRVFKKVHKKIHKTLLCFRNRGERESVCVCCRVCIKKNYTLIIPTLHIIEEGSNITNNRLLQDLFEFSS